MSASPVAEYTLRIAGKRQVTFPEEMLQALNLKKGDEVQVVVNNPSDIRLVPYTRVRKDLLTPEIKKLLEQSRREVREGAPLVSLDEALRKADRLDAARALRSRLRKQNLKPRLKANLKQAEQAAG